MTNPRALVSGLVMGEGPRWHDGRLWFTDFGAGEVLTLTQAGETEVVTRIRTLGLDFAPDGRLLLVSMNDGRLLRREAAGALEAVADLHALSPFPWNELVVDGRGNAYVNNIGFEFPGGEFAPGTVALVRADGSVRQVADGLSFPNGMAVTADDRTLLVAESYSERLTAFDIDAEGGLANRRVWAPLPGGHPDGICLDADGAAWYADVPARRCVRVREGGEVLETIPLDRGAYACMLGGPDGRTLFIMAAEFPAAPGGPRTGQVLAARVAHPRAGRP
jgi:sugar lactone lactonase YvrE